VCEREREREREREEEGKGKGEERERDLERGRETRLEKELNFVAAFLCCRFSFSMSSGRMKAS
jgi:hypothetical protein